MVGGGGAYNGGHISGITKNVSERGDKTNLRNELKQTYHYIKSYIYNTFTVRHNERRIYLKNIYKTQILMFVKERTYTLDGLINERGGGVVISRIISSLENGWAYIRRALKWDFTVSSSLYKPSRNPLRSCISPGLIIGRLR